MLQTNLDTAFHSAREGTVVEQVFDALLSFFRFLKVFDLISTL
jgi:hypothetical protein